MANEREPFPLEQWFDLSKPIERIDAESAEEQIGLYAWKEGIDPNSADVRQVCHEMWQAVTRHNEQLEKYRKVP